MDVLMCEKKKIIINPGCIGCGLCESIAPDVFAVRNISTVKDTYDYDLNADNINKAAQLCPVGAITVQE